MSLQESWEQDIRDRLEDFRRRVRENDWPLKATCSFSVYPEDSVTETEMAQRRLERNKQLLEHGMLAEFIAEGHPLLVETSEESLVKFEGAKHYQVRMEIRPK